jgi:uncharacterized SAM-binding protein YcdF (DUF218 family)
MRWGRVCRLLGVTGFLLFLLAAFTPLPNIVGRRLAVPSRPGPAQAVVALGAGFNSEGVLSEGSLRRALSGILLYREGLAPVIVFSGPSFTHNVPEALVRAEMARDLGVKADAILTETTARTTREEASLIGALLRPREVRRILLVTDSLHMVRARRLFERTGLQVLPVDADDVSLEANSPEGRLRLTRRILQEVLAIAYYRAAGYI